MQRRLVLVLALAGCSSRGESTDSAVTHGSAIEPAVPPRTADTARARATSTDTVATSSPLAPGRIVLPFRARGNEPGWSLDVGAREMTLLADYGEQRVVAATPVPITSGDTTRWAARTRGHRILVTVVDRLCHDGMSGFAFPRTVTVRLDGREMVGCGGERCAPRKAGGAPLDSAPVGPACSATD